MPNERAVDLDPAIWDAIADLIGRSIPGREITFGKVVRRDVPRKLIWLDEFGDLSIPLAYFSQSFSYYDTEPTGVATAGQPIGKRKIKNTSLPKQENTQLQTEIIVPRLGQIAVVLNTRAAKRFPICVGVIQSKGYWQGEV
jgi:hypothetical protein